LPYITCSRSRVLRSPTPRPLSMREVSVIPGPSSLI
jgi:hypothetical protein